MTSKWDEATETWDHYIGTCPYCNGDLIENPDPDLKYSNYSRVQKDNDIILICGRCVRYMQDIGEVDLKEIGDWKYIYEFVTFNKERKKRIGFD